MIVVFGSLIALGIVANILVDNPYAHRVIRVAINEKVHQFTNLRIDFKAVNVRVLPMELSLYGFNLFVEDDQGKSETVASASQIHTAVSLFSLILGTPKLKTIEVTDLKVQYPFVNQIKFHETSATPEDSEPLTWPPDVSLPVYSVALRNASLAYLLPDEEGKEIVRVAAEGIDFEADVDSWEDIRYPGNSRG